MPGSELFGKAFENWCFHELRAYNLYHDIFADFSYWRLAGGTEVDFIINSMEIAIEAKATPKILGRHLKGLRSLKQDHSNVRRRIVVCLEDKSRITDDSIEILPAREFAAKLWQGQIF
jgi:predicted AAA+ superfamily ATPase